MTWILTYTGRRFHPLQPSAMDVCAEDIAHALSNICRYTGHSKRFYSVAEHSIHVATHMPRGMELEGLLHDASEAYLCDLPRPLKQDPAFTPYRFAEQDVTNAIRTYFSLPIFEDPLVTAAVKLVDLRMLATEARQLMPDVPLYGPSSWDIIQGVESYDVDLSPYAEPWGVLRPEQVESVFMQMLNTLLHQRGIQ